MTAEFDSSKFAPGSMHFVVVYADEDLTIPVVQTLMFVERRKSDDMDGGFLYLFREIDARDTERPFSVREEYVDGLVVDRQGVIEAFENLKQSRPK